VELFALWSARYDTDRGDPCAQAQEQRLRCIFQPRGSISQLRTLNLPAILTLTDADGDTHDIVVKALGYGDAIFAVDGKTVNVNLSELTHYWFGDHLMLWRPALAGSRALTPGTRGEDVLWLREALARVRGETIGTDLSPVYDPPLEAKVRQYQREKLLTVDGIVGSMTQLALTTDLSPPGAPTLRKDY
jgi:general secretion pathway protein A